MPVWKKNIFIRVIKSRISAEGKSADEILADYTALTDPEKQEIKEALQ